MAPVLDAHGVPFLINVFSLPGFLAPLQFLCGWIVPHFMPFFGIQYFVRLIGFEIPLNLFIATYWGLQQYYFVVHAVWRMFECSLE